MAVWAARDLLRRPGEALLVTASLALCIACVGTVLLASRALTRTADALVAGGPAVVVRRTTPLGWAPIPLAEGLEHVRRVPGAVDPRGRVWGTVGGPEGAVTVLGADPARRGEAPAPGPGEAVVGRALQTHADAGSLALTGARGERRFRVVDVFDAGTDAATYDLVLLHATDAHDLLGIPPTQASDIVLDVYHEAEAEALARELSGLFPWPVQITTRRETRDRYRSAFGGRSSLLVAVYVPSLLAMGLIAAATLRDRLRAGRETVLRRAMGWTTADAAAFELWRAGTVAGTAAAVGGGAAYAAVFGFGAPWIAGALFAWPGAPPDLALDPSGAAWVLIEVAAIVVAPFLGASLGPFLLHTAGLPEAAAALPPR
jgi:hypothetical protein